MFRTYKSIQQRAVILNATQHNKNYWSDEEISMLEKFYPTEGKSCWCRFKNKTEKQVRDKAKRLHIKKEDNPYNNVWTEEEINIVRENYSAMGYGCKKMLPGRSNAAIARQASLLGVKCDTRNWAPDEDKLLEKYYPIGEIDNLSIMLGKSKNAIMCRAKILGLQVLKQYRYDQKKILCLETNEIFDTYQEAIDKYPKAKYIPSVCSGSQKTSGGYHWCFYDEFTLLNISNQEYITQIDMIGSRGKRVLCVETMKEYNSANEAKRQTGIKNVDACCRGEQASAGGYHWKYIEETENND